MRLGNKSTTNEEKESLIMRCFFKRINVKLIRNIASTEIIEIHLFLHRE